MADPYIGEIRVTGFNYAPQGWAFCNGQLLSIIDYNLLFNLIGTTYGGDGQSTFALPNLQSRIPIHQGQGAGLSARTLGEAAGAESVIVSPSQLPSHTHTPLCNTGNGTSSNPSNNYWAAQPALLQYTGAGTVNANMKPGAMGSTGGGQAHNNMVPHLAINFIIALEGMYPQRS